MMEFYSEVAPEKMQAEGITKALTVFKDTLPKVASVHARIASSMLPSIAIALSVPIPRAVGVDS